MNRHRAIVAATVGVVLLPQLGSAQTRPWPVTQGEHVRVYTSDGDTLRVEGVFESIDGTRLVLTSETGARSLSTPIGPRDLIAVRRIVPRGQRVRQRSLWGAFLGGSLGGISAPFVTRATDSPWSVGTSVVIGVAAGGLIGGGLGAAIGYLLPHHRWERFRLDDVPAVHRAIVPPRPP